MLGPLFALATAAILAQEPQAAPPPPGPPPPQGEALRVFLDCQYECDLDYLRTEVTFVNWVRDRFDAQLLILVTSQQTGGGGTDYALTFIGQRELQGRADTLRYIAPQGATGDERRGGMARVIRLGLVRFTMTTPLAAHLDVRFTPPSGPGGSPRERPDPWNRWVFRTSVNSYFNGQQSNAYRNVYASMSANRTTEDWKISIGAYGGDQRNRYTYTTQAASGADSTVVTRTTIRNWSGDARVVRSVGPHWSAGVASVLSGSTSGNTVLRWGVGPAVEYDLFPYAQSTRRQLTFNYALGVEAARYRETTVYFRTSETYVKHQLVAALGLRQPWGDASLSVSTTQYWNDAPHPNVDLYGNTNLRLVRGLSLNVWGSYSFVQSQRYLAAASVNPLDVLLQLRQLRTSYQYYGGIGFSYTFGSVYNNVVNPRFGGSGS